MGDAFIDHRDERTNLTVHQVSIRRIGRNEVGEHSFGEGAIMNKPLFALLIHDPSEHFDSLRQTLRQLSTRTYSISSCQQAENLLSQCKPDLVFAASCVQDGSWLSVQNFAE